MSDVIPYECPFCGRMTTLIAGRISSNSRFFDIENAQGPKWLITRFKVCPNPKCQRFSLEVELYADALASGRHYASGREYAWRLIPQSQAQVFPEYVPQAIRQDYEEACLIRGASPKASATLARRCLQGMIRDFWEICRRTLFQEVNELESRIDPLTWKAIDAVRKIGNIGAHMEKDVNVIVDVEPEEAAKLIWLIELLVKEWYIHRAEREDRLKDLVAIANEKEDAKREPVLRGGK